MIDGVFVFDNAIHCYDMSDENLRADAPDARYSRDLLLAMGAGGRWSGLYSHLRGEWAITPNLAGAVEVVRYWVGDVIRRAGGHDSQYGNVQLQFSW